jgi:hypothetical protein
MNLIRDVNKAYLLSVTKFDKAQCNNKVHMYMVYSIKKTYGSGGKTRGNKDHELFSPFEINSPNLQTEQVK